MFGVIGSLPKACQLFKQAASLRFSYNNLHTFCNNTTTSELLTPWNLSVTAIRTSIRCYFPRPNEVKRVRRHGWEHRMSTVNGRKILMRKILKGKHVLSH